MSPRRSATALAVAAVALIAGGCGNLPGHPGPDPEVLRPTEILDFDVLYNRNCAGCHGAGGKGGAGVPLSDPVYLAYAADTDIRRAITQGVHGTPMQAFAISGGGILTDRQVDALVSGLRQRWGKPGVLGNVKPPSYQPASPGDASRGEAAYRTFCASCHGADGAGGKAHSIVDPSYLALASDQGLRTTVVVGVPGMVENGKPAAPDWRDDVPGRPMTDQEVSDVVAWLAAHRGTQPVPAAAIPAKGKEESE
jgi:mono/diheme cytochrome c family protein